MPVSSFSETHHMDRQPLLHSQALGHPALHSTSRQPSPICQHSHLPAVLPPSHMHTFPRAAPVPLVSSTFPPKLYLVMPLDLKATDPQHTTLFWDVYSSPLFLSLGVCAGRFSGNPVFFQQCCQWHSPSPPHSSVHMGQHLARCLKKRRH